MTSATHARGGVELSGKWLRWVVCLLLKDARCSMTVAEIVTAVTTQGYDVAGDRAGKTVSDALRWEVRRGRVVQPTRGRYAAGLMQRSTEYSMRRRVGALRTEAARPDGGAPIEPIESIDLDALDTSDAWSGPAPAIFIDELD